MSLEFQGLGVARRRAEDRAALAMLRLAVVAVAVAASVGFIVAGLYYRLQIYGDGSLFSYAVAVQESWAYHWHNISGRLTVYALTCLPAEIYVALTGNAHGGIALYGSLFFGAQLAGLCATWSADRSPNRIIFHIACVSTVCLCPLVFGFPTEMWIAHALFWPAMALCHFARDRIAGAVAVFAILLLLCFTHEGALILAAVIVAGVGLRGRSDPRFLRALGCFVAVLAIWGIVKNTMRPDAYDAPVMAQAAEEFIGLWLLREPVLLELGTALAGYGALWFLLRRQPLAALQAAIAIIAGLYAYWLWFDQSLLAEDRYYLRTIVLLGAGGLGLIAGAAVVAAEGRPKVIALVPPWAVTALRSAEPARLALGALMLIGLVHTVEVGKFVQQWQGYKNAVRSLAMSDLSDPALGDTRFVSSARIDKRLDRLSWFSTTPYLSVLLAPRMAPKRLVIDPAGDYYWVSCGMAKATERSPRSLPVESRSLVRVFACLHR